MFNKKIATILAIVIVVIVIILSVIALAFLKHQESSTYPTKLPPSTSKIIKDTTHKDISESIQTIINNAENSKSEGTRYENLKKLSQYLFSLYGLYHNPEIREYINNELNEYAKHTYSKLYNENDFSIACADPTCGNNIDSEINKIIDEVKSNPNIDSDYKRVIVRNLSTASYIKDEDLEAKRVGMELAANQLLRQGDPTASSSADKIEKYFYSKFKTQLYLK